MGKSGRVKFALLLPVLLLLSACSSLEDATPSVPPASPIPTGDSPLPIGDSPLDEPFSPLEAPPAETEQKALERLAELATAELADQLAVEADEIELIDTEAVQWPDSSLGCPEPGMMYAQVITPGYILTLEVDGQRYVFHTDSDQRVVRCEEG
jgi:hypothetical protein